MAAEWRDEQPATILQRYASASLQQMARTWSVQSKSKGKDVLVTLLSQRLGDPRRIENALRMLAPSERAALDQLQLMGGEAATSALYEVLRANDVVDRAKDSPYGSFRDDRGSLANRGSRSFRDIAARLNALGLVFSASPQPVTIELQRTYPISFIPRIVAEHLSPISLAPPPAAALPRQERAADPSAVQRDLYLMLSAAREMPLDVISTGGLSKRTLVRLDSLFRVSENAAQVKTEGELGRLPLLRAVAETKQLLLAGPAGLVPGPAVDAFFTNSRGQRLQLLYEAYAATPRWSELSRVPLKVTPRTQIYRPEISAARRRVLARIGELPAGQWIALEDLIERMRRQDFEFLLPRTSTLHASYWWYGSHNLETYVYGGNNPVGLQFEEADADPGDRVTWEQVEGALIRVVVTEALFWLGLVDLGLDAAGKPVSFRLTAEGASILRGEVPEMPVAAPNVVIQPNFQIFAFEPTDEGVLYHLDALAERVRAEQAVEYRLTRQSIHAAQNRGIEAGDILTFLQRVSSVSVPQNVTRSIEDWAAQLERIVLHRSTPLLQTADAATMDALYADKELAPRLGRRLAPTVALITRENLEQVQGILTAGGRNGELPLPAFTHGTELGYGRLLTVAPDGRLTFRERVPPIYLHHVINRFAEPQPNGTMLLSKSSLQRAGTTPDAILQVLSELGGEVPPEITALVERWARQWGRAALADVALLQLEQAETASALLADEEIVAWLTPVPDSPTLLLVRRDRIDAVRTHLAELGMEVGEKLPLR